VGVRSAGKYVEAVDALDKLADEMDATQDAKVRHNAAVARFAAGTDGADKLQLALRQSLRALEQEFEKSKSSSNGVDESDAGSSSSSSASIDQEAAFLRYNYAAALFLGKQYAQASAVLETVIRNMDPVDDSVAMHVCFLYLDVVLHSCRGGVTAERERAASIRKAQSVLAFLEQPHRFNTVQEPPEHLVPRDAAGAAVETDTQRKSRLDVTEFRFRLHLYRAKFMLLQSNLKAAKKEMKSALEIFQKEIKSRDDSLALLSLETDKTSSGIGHPSLAVQNSTALFLKANLEYLKKNYKKCIKLLASCTQEAVTEVSPALVA
jgi:CCR4-NOT transcription complex subunit 10